MTSKLQLMAVKGYHGSDYQSSTGGLRIRIFSGCLVWVSECQEVWKERIFSEELEGPVQLFPPRFW